MKNYLVVAVVPLLMACSNLVHFHKEVVDYESPRQPLASVTRSSLKPEEISSMAPHETTELPHGTVLSPPDKTPTFLSASSFLNMNSPASLRAARGLQSGCALMISS